MNAAVTAASADGKNLFTGDALMAKLVDRAQVAVKEAFLDSLTDEQYSIFVRQAMDRFLYGDPAKRFKWVLKERKWHIEDPAKLDETTRIAKNYYQSGWDGPKEYQVEVRELNDSYIADNDPGTFPGMLRAMIQDYAKKNFLQEFDKNPKFQQVMVEVQGEGSWINAVPYFEQFLEDFLKKNLMTIMHAQWGMMLNSATSKFMSDLRNMR